MENNLTPQQKAEEIEQFYKKTFSENNTRANIMAQNDVDIRLKTLLEVDKEILPKDDVTFIKWYNKVKYYQEVLKVLLKQPL